MKNHDLNHPDYNPPDCPAWAKEDLPERILPFRGRNGLPMPFRDCDEPLAMNVRGVDRYHANQFINYRPETAAFLYSEYTPLRVNYRQGTLPSFEALAKEVTAGCRTDTERAVALLTKGTSRVKHPCAPPFGGKVASDRNLDDESLLRSRQGWCNEQARVFVRLCQVSGIPARIVQLFYADGKTGHCIAECHADGRWAMADATYLCVFPDAEGRLLSAAQCHDKGEGQKRCGMAYYKRYQEILGLSDAEINAGDAEATAKWRAAFAAHTAKELSARLYCFGVINYPLPPSRP